MRAGGPGPVIQAWSWDSACIFRHTAVSFDAGDPDNAGLYLCDPAATGLGAPVLGAIAHLRGRSLWSGDQPQQLADAQRRTHAEQSQVVQAVEFRLGARLIVAVRCEHARQPSGAQRFRSWVDALQEIATRLEPPAPRT